MAIQILPPQESLAEKLGQGLGTGLNSVLQYKLNNLLAQQQAQQQARALEAVGLPGTIAYLAPEIQKQIITQKLQEPSNKAYRSALGELLGVPQEQMVQEELLEPMQQAPLIPQPTAISKQKAKARIAPAQPEIQAQAPFATQQPIINPTAEQIPTKRIGTLATLQSIGEEIQRLTKPRIEREAEKAIEPEKEIKEEHIAVAKKTALSPETIAKLTPEQLEKIVELKGKKQQLSHKDIVESYKLTKDERREIVDKAKAARTNLRDLERLEELEKEGKLDTPGYVEFLDRAGLNIPALMNPGSEEFNKITQGFLKSAKDVFGARISNYEISQFLRTLPSLSQSPEGRKRIIANLKYLARSGLEYLDTMKEVIKENDNVPPLDLAEQIEDRIENKLDKLADKFKEDLKRPVPEPQPAAETAFQAIAGSLLGAPGRLLGSIGNVFRGGAPVGE